MSYQRMSVYSFECDYPVERHGPGGEYEILPMFGRGLRAALAELRAAGWLIRDGKQFCPAHKVAARRRPS